MAQAIASDERLLELEKKLHEMTAERDFLKKAAAFFARDHR
ncbi:hypothetical protein [Streptomyces sp. NPDC057910]